MKSTPLIVLYYCLEPSVDRVQKGTAYLLREILSHEGRGSLCWHLKANGLIEYITADDYLSARQVTHFLYVEIYLTEEGLK